MTVTVTSALAGPATARYSNVYGALVDLGVLSGLGAQDVTGSGDPVAPILNASEFYAPLTHSLVLTRGTGSATYSRATNAWEFDNEGKLILVPSGAARFGGARMVRNLITYTEDLSNAAWTKTRTTISANATADINGSLTADKIIEDSTASNNHYVRSAVSPASQLNDVFCLSIYLKAGERSRVGLWNNGGSPRAVLDVNLATGTITPSVVGDSTVVNSSITSAGGGWYRVVLTTKSPSLALASIYLFLQDAAGSITYDGDGTSGLYAWGAQIENVTGQADQSASEYVSVGVLSAPYHGAGVDGVKWVATNKDGSAISASSLLGCHAEGARMNSLLGSRDLDGTDANGVVYWVPSVSATEIATNGSFASDTAWTKSAATVTITGGVLRFTAAAANDRAYQTPSPTLKDNTTYKVTYTVSGYASGSVRVFLYGATTNHNGATPTVSANGTYTAYIRTATSGSAANELRVLATSAGTTLDVDDLSVVEETMAVSACTGIDNAANSASTLTAGAADATILQTLSMAAAARSFSAYVKRRTGTGNVYITRDGGTNWTDITASVGASWTRVKIENTSVLNPQVGFKIATSGDAIDVDVCQDEAGAFITSPIITTTAAVTRNAELLDYATTNTSANSTFAGTWYTKTLANSVIQPIIGTKTNSIEGLGKKATSNNFYIANPSESTTDTGSALTVNTFNKFAGTLNGTTRSVSANGGAVSSAADASSWTASKLRINSDGWGSTSYGYLKDVYIWSTPLTDAQLQQVTA